MITKIFFAAALLTMSMAAQAQSEDKVEASSASTSIGFSISTSPKLEIGADKLTFSNDKNSITFDANERVVLRIKPANQNGSTTLGDVNGDGVLTIDDITILVNKILNKK